MALNIIGVLAQELQLKEWQIKNTVELFDQGNTIPFVARYRKEKTGELDEQVLRDLEERLNYLRNLEERKQEVLRLISEQDKLTPELAAKITEADKVQQVEDLYRPFRPKRRTRATIAREKGLEPLANLIWEQEADLNFLKDYSDEDIAGARDILAERVADDAVIRQIIRELTYKNGEIVSTKSNDDPIGVYRMYEDYREPLRKIPPHRVLALNRGEKEQILRVRVEVSDSEAISLIQQAILRNNAWTQELKAVAEDAYKRLLAPSIERELRSELTETAEAHAIEIFAKNLRALLLQPPIHGRVVMGIDPGYRTGCKIAVVNEFGDVSDTATIYPHPPQKHLSEARDVVISLIRKYGVTLIAIGNGTASRETEQMVAEIGEVPYAMVSEAGASVYSASPLAREELPNLDVSMRGAVSIARRLQDPLAELVKIDPKSIGVGQYQHDVNQNRLADALSAVVESCVNYVGVELNSASPALLGYVAGISGTVAKNIVAYRQEHGPFRSRAALLKVPRLGPAAFRQCAGFLRVPESDNVLDNTAVHPESYDLAQQILAVCPNEQDLKGAEPRQLAAQFDAGVPTVRDILDSLLKPGRDPRDEMSSPVLRTDVLTLEDLRPGMELTGTVRNVVDFGAFVDIGVKQDGLVHISQLADRYVKHPLDVVSVGDVVTVGVLDVDLQRQRIALTMKAT